MRPLRLTQRGRNALALAGLAGLALFLWGYVHLAVALLGPDIFQP